MRREKGHEKEKGGGGETDVLQKERTFERDSRKMGEGKKGCPVKGADEHKVGR